MPILRNAKHERFAQELAGGNSAAKSYEMAGFTPNRHNASTLSRKHHILDRVAELLSERDRISKQSSARAIEAAGLTKQWVLEALIENAMVALGRRTIRTKFVPCGECNPVEVEVTAHDPSAANRALELLGKHLALWVERAEVGKPGAFDRLSDDELRAEIDRLTLDLFGVKLTPDDWLRRRGRRPAAAALTERTNDPRAPFMNERNSLGRLQTGNIGGPARPRGSGNRSRRLQASSCSTTGGNLIEVLGRPMPSCWSC